MNTRTSPLQLRRLDEAVVALLQERARLCAATGLHTDRGAVTDLLRRADGSLPAAKLQAVFDLLEDRRPEEQGP